MKEVIPSLNNTQQQYLNIKEEDKIILNSITAYHDIVWHSQYVLVLPLRRYCDTNLWVLWLPLLSYKVPLGYHIWCLAHQQILGFPFDHSFHCNVQSALVFNSMLYALKEKDRVIGSLKKFSHATWPKSCGATIGNNITECNFCPSLNLKLIQIYIES